MPVFRLFATERLYPILRKGNTVHRTYMGDFIVNTLGGAGDYSTQAVVDTDETLVVNTTKEVSMQLPEWQELQLHLPTAKKFGEKALAALWNNLDANMLSNMITNAASTVDDGSIGGTSGNPIALSTGNVMAVFAAAELQLIAQNVKYIPNKQFTGIPMVDMTGGLMASAAISPHVNFILGQAVAGKNSALGDKVTTNGYIGYFFGFNIAVSNQLLWEGQLAMPTIPTAGDTFTLLSGVTRDGGVSQAITFTFRASPSVAGDVIVSTGTAAQSATNIKNALNAPYTLIANSQSSGTGFFNFTQSSLTATQVYLLSLVTASVVSSTTVKILIAGFSLIPVAAVFTSTNNSWAKQIQHNLMGTSQSIDLIMQKKPNMAIRPVSGRVAYDYVLWNLYGYKVFNDQLPQLVDVQIDASVLTTAPSEVSL